LLERLIRGSGTWAIVDAVAPYVAGPLVEREQENHPEIEAVLERWASDDDFWVRRAALLVHLLPLRRGEGDFAGFARHADAMLGETEFFVRKAIGWVLREVGKKRPELVAEWLLPRADRASGVTVREAVKYLAGDDRGAILAAHRGGPGRVAIGDRPGRFRTSLEATTPTLPVVMETEEHDAEHDDPEDTARQVQREPHSEQLPVPAVEADPDQDDRQGRQPSHRRHLQRWVIRRQHLESGVHEREREHGADHDGGGAEVFLAQRPRRRPAGSPAERLVAPPAPQRHAPSSWRL
jgi:hypothetical protein